MKTEESEATDHVTGVFSCDRALWRLFRYKWQLNAASESCGGLFSLISSVSVTFWDAKAEFLDCSVP